MEKNLTSLKLEEGHQIFFKCNECHGTFEKPILATVNSRGYAQTYYACPRCLTKVAVAKASKEKKEKDISSSIEKVERAEVKESVVECKHFLGYLKKRPKGTSIPDECLVCDKMVECLIH